MKKFNDYLQENLFSNPNDDIEKYITGLSNRLSLLRSEEVQAIHHKLEELRDLINNVLKR